MTSRFATCLFRLTFVLAGCYNFAFGIWAGFWPRAFFAAFDIDAPRYPQIWACLGMVVGVYGFLYLHVAWKPQTGRPIIAIGLLGKTLGPIGMALTLSDDWPRRLAMLNVYNDLIWLLPFGLFLVRGTALARRLVDAAPWICAAVHGIALVAMATVLQPGTPLVSDVAERAAYIARHSATWSAGWLIWMLSANTLVGFYAWWGSRIKARLWAILAVMLAGLGMVFDLSGETLLIALAVEWGQLAASHSRRWSAADFANLERISTLLTAGAANGLYTLGGIALTLNTPRLPAWIRAALWGTWLAGAVMTLAALGDHLGLMVAATCLLFPLLIVWTIWMGRTWNSLR